MDPPRSPFWTALLVLLCFLPSAVACPAECFCFGSTRVTVHCDFRNLSSIPLYIPLNTTHLYGRLLPQPPILRRFLSGNKLTVVTPDMFIGYSKDELNNWVLPGRPLFQLSEIKLDLNPMPIVSEFAFNPAPTLRLIYLPFFTTIQHQGISEMRLDGKTFSGYDRVEPYPLEDPTYIAFTNYDG
ncbi:Aste57867_14027 [Aphanomyces stellatus]|uniref:Aste57867_14027 protein n=1 Tax=Aphanomyces stellatus TaxID=120398 RepID=A0A485L0J6_9STRA|nr:hypothetical protein As57867_013976 [Aphanomyces stellatus]VFT90857.1 Aste57867_14027 [Aphanomyces stellatus]